MRTKRSISELDQVTDLMKSSFTLVEEPNPVKRKQPDLDKENRFRLPKRKNLEKSDDLLERVRSIAEAMATKRRMHGKHNPYTDNSIDITGNDVVTVKLNLSLLGNIKLSKGLLKTIKQRNDSNIEASPQAGSDFMSIVLPRSTLVALLSNFESQLQANKNHTKIEELDSDSDDDDDDDNNDGNDTDVVMESTFAENEVDYNRQLGWAHSERK